MALPPDDSAQTDMPPGHPAGPGGGRPPHGSPDGGGGRQLAALLQTQSEILRKLAEMEASSQQGAPPGPPRGRPRPPPPPPRLHLRPSPPDGGPPGPPQAGPPPGPQAPPPHHGHSFVSSLAHTLGDVANAAAATVPVVQQIASSFHGTGAVTPVAVNPVWATLAQVLNEVVTSFRVTGVPSEKESFLRVVEHLATVVSGLAASPNDPALLAEYQEMSVFLAAHPDSQALSSFIATHPAIAPVVAAAAPLAAATGWGGRHPYDMHYPPLYVEAPPVWWPVVATGQQLDIIGPSIHKYRASGALDIVGPSIHRYRASGGLDIVGPSIHRYRASGIDIGNIARTLTDVAKAAAQTASAVPQLTAAISSAGLPPNGASTGWVVPMLGGFALGSLYRGWLDRYVADAARSCQVTTGAVVPVVVNPVWATLAKVLTEVSTGFRVTGVPPEKETFLRVVEHLAKVANALALTPNDPTLLSEYQELSAFLASHPDSTALAEFIGTHPAIVPAIAPVIAPVIAVAPPAHATGWATGALPPTTMMQVDSLSAVRASAAALLSNLQSSQPTSPMSTQLLRNLSAIASQGSTLASIAAAIAAIRNLGPGMASMADDLQNLVPPAHATGWTVGALPYGGMMQSDSLSAVRGSAAVMLANVQASQSTSPMSAALLRSLSAIADPGSTLGSIAAAIAAIRNLGPGMASVAADLQNLMPRDHATGGLLEDVTALLRHPAPHAPDMTHAQESNPGWGLGPGYSAPSGDWMTRYDNEQLHQQTHTGPGAAVAVQYR